MKVNPLFLCFMLSFAMLFATVEMKTNTTAAAAVKKSSTNVTNKSEVKKATEKKSNAKVEAAKADSGMEFVQVKLQAQKTKAANKKKKENKILAKVEKVKKNFMEKKAKKSKKVKNSMLKAPRRIIR